MRQVIWNVAECPSGPYASFQARDWPSAVFKGTAQLAANIFCDDEYYPANVKTGNHPPLRIVIFILDGKHLKRKYLKIKAECLTHAKDLVDEYYEAHPEIVDYVIEQHMRGTM